MLIKKSIEQGFTLIEAMVAMLIVSVGLLAMASLLITAIRVNNTNEVRLEASTLAQSTMAYYVSQVRAQPPFTPAVNFAGGDTLPPTLVNATVYDAPAAIFTPVVTFIPVTTVECQFTDIEVKLSWTMHGQTKSVKIRSGAMTDKVGGCSG